MNIAITHGVKALPNERQEDFIKRTWSVYNDVTIDAAGAWSELSEVLHGRAFCDAIYLDLVSSGTRDKIKLPRDAGVLSVHELVARVLEISSKQVRAAAGGILPGGESADAVRSYLLGRTHISERPSEREDFAKSLMPIDHLVALSERGKKMVDDAASYRLLVGEPGFRQTLMEHPSPGLAQAAMLERQARTVERERFAYHHESTVSADGFDSGYLSARLFRYIATSEAMAITATWASGNERHALSVASVALKSAWQLWVEDSDIALFCMRVAIEQVCRARAWRIKPNRASKVENHTQSVPSRWVEAAGWGRLTVVSRALSEFSHLHGGTRHTGARTVLENFQDTDNEFKSYTARGYALDATFLLLAEEVCARFAILDPALEEVFRQAVTLMTREDQETQIEDFLIQGLNLRGHDFGRPDVERATEEALREGWRL